MASYLGVDWADSGWVVAKAGDETRVAIEPSILNVWAEHGRSDDVRSILVDIPIGLPENGPRACDAEASDRLAGRSSSVFSIPGREVVEAEKYEKAREMNDGSLGSQSWWLFPRIREVDVFLQEFEEAREKVYESHPEICFTELASGSLGPKDSEDGMDDRLEMLRADPDLHHEVVELVAERRDGSEWHHRISKGRLDDIVDAAGLALTGKELALGPRNDEDEYPSLPENSDPGIDDVIGILPEIVYPRT